MTGFLILSSSLDTFCTSLKNLFFARSVFLFCFASSVFCLASSCSHNSLAKSSDVSILARVPRSMMFYSQWRHNMRNLFSAMMFENK